MALITNTVVATSTAALLYKNTGYTHVQVTMTTHGNSADVYVGPSNVTASSNGIVVPKSTTLQMTVPAGESLFCAGNGTDTVKWVAFTGAGNG
jgi:hypothetical protein